MGFAFVEFKSPKSVDNVLTTLQGVHIYGSYWVAERHIRPKNGTRTPDYSIPPAAKNLLHKASKILELSGIIDDPTVVDDDEYFNHVEHDIRAECSQIGRVKSIHLPRLRYTKASTSSIDEEDLIHMTQNQMEFSKDAKNALFPLTPSNFLKPNSKQIDRKSVVEDSCSGLPDYESNTFKTEKLQDESEQKNTTSDAKKINQIMKRKDRSKSKKTIGIGKVFIEFTLPEVTCMASHNLHNRIFEGRIILTRYYPFKKYQRYFNKGLTPVTSKEKIQLSLDTQEKLMLSDAKLFPNVNLR